MITAAKRAVRRTADIIFSCIGACGSKPDRAGGAEPVINTRDHQLIGN